MPRYFLTTGQNSYTNHVFSNLHALVGGALIA